MLPIQRRHQVWLLAGIAMSLAGCATQKPQQALSPAPAPITSAVQTIHLTPAELQLIERHAYNRGFAAGRTAARDHQQSAPTPGKTTDTSPQTALPVTSSPDPSGPSSDSQPEPALQPHAPAATAPVYVPSGPARPLSP